MLKSLVQDKHQLILISKTDFDNKLKRLIEKLNKIKKIGVLKKLNSLTTRDYNFFLGRMYFTSNDGSQNTFCYQPTLDTLKLKKTKVLIIFLDGNQRENIILNLSYYILHS